MTIRTEHADVLIIGSGATGARSRPRCWRGGAARRLPRAGRLGRAPRPSPLQRRLAVAAAARWNADVNVRTGNPDDFPGPQQLLPGADVERGRRLDQRLRRALAALSGPPTSARAPSTASQPDWPISYEDIDPYYDRADRLVGVSGLAGDPAMPPQTTTLTPPLPMQPASRAQARRKPSSVSAGTGGRFRRA